MAALNYFLALLLQVVVLVTANNATLPPFRRAHHSSMVSKYSFILQEPMANLTSRHFKQLFIH